MMLLCKDKTSAQPPTHFPLTSQNSMKAWGKSLDANKSSGIRFLADPTGEFSKAWDVTFDATPILGNHRSKRYATTVENGKVVKAAVEPDNTGISSKPPNLISSQGYRLDQGVDLANIQQSPLLTNSCELYESFRTVDHLPTSMRHHYCPPTA